MRPWRTSDEGRSPCRHRPANNGPGTPPCQTIRQRRKALQERVTAYFEQFAERDEEKRKQLEAGEITQQDFIQWRLAQISRGKAFEKLRELIEILGFDPDELNTPEMDLRRFGFYDDGGDEQAQHTGKSPDTQAQGSGAAYP